MPNEQVVIPVGGPECDPTKPAECRENTYTLNLSKDKPESGQTSPDCAFFVPLTVAALLTKAFLGLHKRKNLLFSRSTITYSQE